MVPFSSISYVDPHESGFAISEVAQTSLELANYLDEWRFLPQSVSISDMNLTISSFLWVASRAAMNIQNQDMNDLPVPPSIPNPDEMYASVNLVDAAFGETLDKDEYLLLISEIVSLDEALDQTMVLDTSAGKLRFVDVAYLVSQVLRFYVVFEFLPSLIEIPVISIENLLPWKTPPELGNYTSALDNSYASAGGEFDEFYQVNFYAGCATDYDVLNFALDIVGDIDDPYEAAKRIYDYIRSENWIYCHSSLPAGRGIVSVKEWLRLPYHTSAIPAFKFCSLFKALGIPVKYRGTYGEVYFEDIGWVEVGTHASSFGELEPEPFAPGMVEPIHRRPDGDDVLIRGIKQVMADGKSLDVSLPYRNSIIVNPTDIEILGPKEVVRRVVEAGFDSLLVTVKAASGYIFYDSLLYKERVRRDILSSLVPEASKHGIKVYAVLAGLFDEYTSRIEPDWRATDWSGTQHSFFISPCIDQYRDYLGQMISEILQSYDVLGVVLLNIYFPPGTGFNKVCIEKFRDETGLNVPDTAPYETETIDTAFRNWRWDIEERYVAYLTEKAHSVRADAEVIYGSIPLPGPVRSLWTNIYRTDSYGFWTAGYYHSPQRIANISKVTDRVMIFYASNFWFNPTSFQLRPPFWDIPEGSYSIYELFQVHLKETLANISSVGGKVAAATQLTEEWPFPPEFYFSVISLFKEFGVEWVSFYKPDILGDLGPSVSPKLWDVLSLIRPQVVIDGVAKKSRVDVGATAHIFLHASWMNNMSSSGNLTLIVGDLQAKTDSAGWADLLISHSEIGETSYRVTKVVTGDRAMRFAELIPTPSVVWDRVNIDSFSSVDNRIDVGCEAQFHVSGKYEYDGAPWLGSFVLNDTTTKDTVGKYGFKVVSIKDENYGLTAFIQSAPDVALIFDRVLVTSLETVNNRIDVGSTAQIFSYGIYEYDNVTWVGTITLNDTIRKDIMGRFWFSVSSVEDEEFGLTAFIQATPDINIMWDSIQVEVQIENSAPGIALVKVHPKFEYDDSPVENSQVRIDGVASKEVADGSYEVFLPAWSPWLRIDVMVEKQGFKPVVTTAFAYAFYNIVAEATIIALVIALAVLATKRLGKLRKLG